MFDILYIELQQMHVSFQNYKGGSLFSVDNDWMGV